MDSTFVTVAVFTYSAEAGIIKGRLDAEGVETFLVDNLTIDTDPLVSNAIGGIKLKVRKEDEEKAREILATINEYSVDDAGKEIHCPNCGATEIHYFSDVTDLKSLAALLFGFLFGTLPFYTKYAYRCEICREKFNLQKISAATK